MKRDILLVEYCSATIDTIKALLHHEMLEISVAGTADVAKKLLSNNKYDLLITEALLPKSHGFKLSKYTATKCPGTKIIVISDQLKELDYKTKAMSKYGATDFIEKPLKGPEFQSKIFELLNIDEQEFDPDYDEGMTTNINIVPLLRDLKFNTKKDVDKAAEKFDDIIDEVNTGTTYEIKLDD
ncbi:MAG: response regulator [bacterium]|nr:response regulator [bacterium]